MAGAHVGPQSVLGPPLLGGRRRRGRALGAARPRDRGRRRRTCARACSAERVRIGDGRAGRAGRDARERAPWWSARRDAWSSPAPGSNPERGRAVGELDRATRHRGRWTRQGMLGDVLAQPLQLGDALWRAQSAGIPTARPPGGLVVCGMGGSAIGGDLAAAALGDRATRPITHGARLRARALDSARTRSCSARATRATPRRRSPASRPRGAAGAQRVVLTTGGKLAELARAEGVPVIGDPVRDAAARGRRLHDGRRARVRRRCAAPRPSLRAEIEAAAALLERARARSGGPTRRGLAGQGASHAALHGTVPGDHGGGHDRGGRPALAGPAQRERQAARLLRRAARGEPQRDLRLGAGAPRPRSAPSSSRTRTSTRACASAWSSPPRRCERAGAPALALAARGESRARARAVAGAAGRPRERLPGGARGRGPRPTDRRKPLAARSSDQPSATPNLDTTRGKVSARDGRADDPRGRGDHRLVAANAALHRERGPDRAAPDRAGLPHLRAGRAAAPAHPARAARRGSTARLSDVAFAKRLRDATRSCAHAVERWLEERPRAARGRRLRRLAALGAGEAPAPARSLDT